MDHFTWNLMFTGPTAAVFVLMGFYLFNHFAEVRRRTVLPMQFGLTPQGIYSSQGESEFWWDWSTMHRAELKKNKMVIQSISHIDPIELTENMFESPGSFETFVKLVERFRE